MKNRNQPSFPEASTTTNSSGWHVAAGLPNETSTTSTSSCAWRRHIDFLIVVILSEDRVRGGGERRFYLFVYVFGLFISVALQIRLAGWE